MVEKMYRLLVVAITLILLFFAKPVISFAKELNQDMYPYRACFRGTVQKIRFDKIQNSWLTTVRTSEVYLKDEYFPALQVIDEKILITPICYANLQPNHTYKIRTWGKVNDVYGMPAKQAIGKEFLWSLDSDRAENEIWIDSNSEITLFSDVPSSKLESIKKQVAGTGEKWAATKSYLQAEIEKQWSPGAIKEFTKHPDARVNPGVQSYTGPRTLSGMLYPEQEKELGKITWYAVFNSPHKFDGIDVMVKKGDDSWRLYPIPLDEPAPNKDEELSRLLTILGHNAFRCYSLVHNVQTLRAPSVSKLTHQSDGTVLVQYTLEGGGILTMTLDSKFQMSDVKLNGEPSELWSKVFSERFENMEKRIGDYRK